MKTTLLILFLTGFGLWAQTPPPSVAGVTNRDAIFRNAVRRAINGGTNVSATTSPASPGATPPSAPATPAAPGTTLAPAAPGTTPVPTAPGTTPASTTSDEPEETFPPGFITFQSASIDQVLTIYAELVGRTILRPATLAGGNIVLKTQTLLTKTEAIQALDAVLSLSGITMINVGEKFVKAVPTATANTEAAAFDRRDVSQLPDMGQYITHILQVTNAKPSELQQVLQAFAKLPNSILPIDSSGILVLRDNAENVKRMLEMIKEMDVSAPSEFLSEVIPIKYALASDIASALSSLSGGGGGGASVGSRGTTSSRSSAGGTQTRPGMNPGMNNNGMPGMPGQPNMMSSPGANQAGTPSSTSSFSDRLRNIINKASASGEMQILGQNKIIADERTNSLLIFASRQDMAIIKDIVSKLDVVLAQVLIETVILDVTLSDNHSFGVSYLQDKAKTVGNSFNGIGALNNTGFLTWGSFSAVTNGSSPALGNGLSYLGHFSKEMDMDVTLTAIAGDNSVKVIQRPRIMTSHAKAASVFIGETVPYISSTYYGGGYNGGPSSSYQQMSVGIGLNVTPFINPDGLVVMTIDETIDDISGYTTVDGNSVPNTTHRTLSDEIAVRDRETIVLGGFIKSSKTNNKTGMPILKDIPLLGMFFSSTTKSKERDELLVLMRPTVLKTPEMAAAHTAEEKRRLPGIRQAEAEDQAYEDKRAKQAEDALKQKAEKPSGQDAQGFRPMP